MGGSRYPSSEVELSPGGSSLISFAGPGVELATCFPGSYV